jgi:hypothetical protein
MAPPSVAFAKSVFSGIDRSIPEVEAVTVCVSIAVDLDRLGQLDHARSVACEPKFIVSRSA